MAVTTSILEQTSAPLSANERGSLALEHGLLIAAALITAVFAMPVFLDKLSVYLTGFNEPTLTTPALTTPH